MFIETDCLQGRNMCDLLLFLLCIMYTFSWLFHLVKTVCALNVSESIRTLLLYVEQLKLANNEHIPTLMMLNQ